MHNRQRSVLLPLMIASLVLVPLLTYAMWNGPSRLESFLVQRQSLLRQLEACAQDLPEGFEHVLPPARHALHPGEAHIRSVVGSGQQWFQDSCFSYDIRLTGEQQAKSPRELVIELHTHFATGLGKLGLTSPKSGGPDWLVETHRAAHTDWWANSDRSLLVTLSVVVDTDSNSAHIVRFVHERCE
ncbi:MAG: hypothetical protein KDA58_04675 [Planctomycetaceae bacterium]|nr:hypothetical protein [Planctomycetaceae bacterium]